MVPGLSSPADRLSLSHHSKAHRSNDLSSPNISTRLALPVSTEGPSHVSHTTLGIDLGRGGQERQRTISRAGFNRTGNRQHHYQRGSWCVWENQKDQHETRSYEYDTTTVCLRKTSSSTARLPCRPGTPGLCGMPPARPTSNGAR